MKFPQKFLNKVKDYIGGYSEYARKCLKYCEATNFGAIKGYKNEAVFIQSIQEALKRYSQRGDRSYYLVDELCTNMTTCELNIFLKAELVFIYKEISILSLKEFKSLSVKDAKF